MNEKEYKLTYNYPEGPEVVEGTYTVPTEELDDIIKRSQKNPGVLESIPLSILREVTCRERELWEREKGEQVNKMIDNAANGLFGEKE